MISPFSFDRFFSLSFCVSSSPFHAFKKKVFIGAFARRFFLLFFQLFKVPFFRGIKILSMLCVSLWPKKLSQSYPATFWIRYRNQQKILINLCICVNPPLKKTKYPAPWSNWMSNYQSLFFCKIIIERFSFSYFARWMFFFLVCWMPKCLDQNKTNLNGKIECYVVNIDGFGLF